MKSMTVGTLIKELAKYPKRAYWNGCGDCTLIISKDKDGEKELGVIDPITNFSKQIVED